MAPRRFSLNAWMRGFLCAAVLLLGAGPCCSRHMVGDSLWKRNATYNVSMTTEIAVTTPPVNTEPELPGDLVNPVDPPNESKETIISFSVFFILLLLFFSILLVHLMIKYQFRYLPESIAFVLIGFIVGLLLFISELFSGVALRWQEKFSPQSFFLLLLPPIIFESGYSLHKGNFFENLGSIVLFAVMGTAISALIVGGGLFGLGKIGIVYELDLIQSFAFGCLISAVDPVATLAIFHGMDVNPTLNMLVFGESVLNDAVSIVMTK